MPKAQVLAYPCSRAVVQTQNTNKRSNEDDQTKLIYTADTASAEQTVRRFFYGRSFGVDR
jgi:hypothetical protein